MRELFLLIRPEERSAVETGLLSVVGPIYTVMQVQGRGSEGGLRYEEEAKKKRWSWKKESLSIFLPKLMYYLVVPEELVDELLRAVGVALRMYGGPDHCGFGFAMVCPLEDEIPINGIIPASRSSENSSPEMIKPPSPVRFNTDNKEQTA